LIWTFLGVSENFNFLKFISDYFVDCNFLMSFFRAYVCLFHYDYNLISEIFPISTHIDFQSRQNTLNSTCASNLSEFQKCLHFVPHYLCDLFAESEFLSMHEWVPAEADLKNCYILKCIVELKLTS